jgi:hypothetical protein
MCPRCAPGHPALDAEASGSLDCLLSTGHASSVYVMRETFTFDRTDRMSDILYGVAVAHGLIEYERLAHRIGMQANHMTHLLAEVSETSVAAGGPMWTALCVSAHTDRPHGQFHQLARNLRPEYAELTDEEVWQTERQRCYDAAQGRSVVVAGS